MAGVGACSTPGSSPTASSAALLWVDLFVLGGYFFGSLPTIKQNFSLVVLAIIAVSMAPILIEFVRSRRQRTA